MTEIWYPPAKRDNGESAGNYTGGPKKCVIHTTEGASYAGALGAYRKHKGWPHFTVSFEGRVFRVWQHIPIDKAARALMNKSGGVQTNTDGAIQIEIVGTADPRNAGRMLYVENFPKEYLDGIKKLLRWVEVNSGVKRKCTVKFKAYPPSYGPNNGVRLSGPAWDAYDGICGHMHVPENDHGDPGLINIAYLLEDEQAPIIIAEEEDDVAYEMINAVKGTVFLSLKDRNQLHFACDGLDGYARIAVGGVKNGAFSGFFSENFRVVAGTTWVWKPGTTFWPSGAQYIRLDWKEKGPNGETSGPFSVETRWVKEA